MPKMFGRFLNNTLPLYTKEGYNFEIFLHYPPIIRPGWERCAVALGRVCTWYIKIANVVCCTPNTLHGAHLFPLHLFPTLSVTLFTIALIKCSACQYSTFCILFFHKVTFSFSCTYYLLNKCFFCLYMEQEILHMAKLFISILWRQFLPKVYLTLCSMILLTYRKTDFILHIDLV